MKIKLFFSCKRYKNVGGNSSTGFTLIELLVVIAFIGMLSAVVLASLNTTRGKGANAAIKGDLNTLRSQAQIVYETNNGSYSAPSDICSDPVVVKSLDSASMVGSSNTTSDVCNSVTTKWAASVPLKNAEGANTYWCVDSDGSAKGEASGLVAGGATICS